MTADGRWSAAVGGGYSPPQTRRWAGGMHLDHPFAEQEAPLALVSSLLIFSNGRRHALMRGQIDLDGDVPVMGGYAPVTEDLVPQMLATYGLAPLRFVAPEVVAHNHNAAAWYVPPQRRTLHFQPRDDRSLKRCSGLSFPQPPLLLSSVHLGDAAMLRVFALEEARRPEPHTRLMLAPYLNTYDTHHVCFGSNPLPAGGGVEHSQAWETLLYDTPFSHAGGGLQRWTPQLTHSELWQRADRDGAFDPAWLMPAPAPRRTRTHDTQPLTLEDFLCTASTLS